MGTNNTVDLEGNIVSEPIFDHQIKQRKMYSFDLAIIKGRGSGFDVITIVASDTTLKKSLVSEIPFTEDVSGKHVCISGEFRNKRMPDSYNRKFVYAYEIDEVAINPVYGGYINQVELTGRVIKRPYIGQSASGVAKCETLIAVKRDNSNVMDYIPIVAWNKCSGYLSKAKFNDTIHVAGEIRQRFLTYKDTGRQEVLHEVRAKRVEVSHETDND